MGTTDVFLGFFTSILPSAAEALNIDVMSVPCYLALERDDDGKVMHEDVKDPNNIDPTKMSTLCYAIFLTLSGWKSGFNGCGL